MPILNIIVVVIVLLIAYMWTAQGFFSAMLHFVCTVVAGAVAFAVWEPLVLNLLLGVREDIAWSVGLAAPFVVTLVLLRLASDKLIPANVELDATTNFLGGGAFGLASGVITMGIIVISAGFMSVPASLMGFQPMGYDRATGSLTRAAGSGLWLPVDRLTSEFYERLSVGGFSTSTPLAVHQPNVDEQAGAIHVTFEGKSRTTLKPADFTVVGRYTVHADKLTDLLSDGFTVANDGRPIPQQALMPSGEQYPQGSRLEGFVIEFSSGAMEKVGQVVIGPGQLRLVSDCGGGRGLGVHPVTVIGQSQGASLALGRFRFNAPEVFVASVGGASTAKMAFEFVVPPDCTPEYLLVRNIRTNVDEVAVVAEQMTPQQRDEAVVSGSLLDMQDAIAAAPPSAGAGAGASRPSQASTAPSSAPAAGAMNGSDREALRAAGVAVANGLTVGILNKQSRGGLTVNDDNEIEGGEHVFTRDVFNQRQVPSAMRVTRFATTTDTQMVQIDVSVNRRASLLGRAVDMAESILPPMLTDTLGQQYEAVGYIHDAGSTISIRYTPGRPIRGVSEIPTLSRSKPNEKLTLLFRVTKGVQVDQFSLGNEVIIEFSPPMPVG